MYVAVLAHKETWRTYEILKPHVACSSRRRNYEARFRFQHDRFSANKCITGNKSSFSDNMGIL
jgi:hypothetical protein